MEFDFVAAKDKKLKLVSTEVERRREEAGKKWLPTCETSKKSIRRFKDSVDLDD